MELVKEFNISECPAIEIASYVDGELSLERELELEVHFADCPQCREEIQLQRQFLCTLNSRLTGDLEVELPANFTKQIVTNAESSVSGLRKASERLNAAFICMALFIFVLFALGSDAFGLFAGIGNAFEKTVAVAGLAGHVVLSFLVGVGVVLRSLSGHLSIPALAMLFSAIALVLLLRYSRSLFGLRRT